MEIPLTVADHLARAELVYGDRIGVVDEPDQPAPPMPEEAGPSSDPRYASRDIAARIRDLWA